MSLYGTFHRTRTFSQIYTKYEDFLADYNEIPYPKKLTEANLQILYYLLYADYGNSNIASSDENRFRFKLFGIVFQNGPVWQKKLQIQNNFLELSDDEICMTNKQTYNHAENPGEGGTTTDTTDMNMTYVDSQNVQTNERSKLEAYADYYSVLKDPSTDFLAMFKKLFITIVEPENDLLYETDEGEE